jgi:signal transduction histidine kinase
LSLKAVDGARSLELAVSDDGPGIDPEIRNELFSPFKTTKEEGTGLGLSVVARIACGHGGSVRVEDAPGGGATFRVRWPVGAAAPVQPVRVGVPAPTPQLTR